MSQSVPDDNAGFTDEVEAGDGAGMALTEMLDVSSVKTLVDVRSLAEKNGYPADFVLQETCAQNLTSDSDRVADLLIDALQSGDSKLVLKAHQVITQGVQGFVPNLERQVKIMELVDNPTNAFLRKYRVWSSQTGENCVSTSS
jgi:hypothetical protein